MKSLVPILGTVALGAGCGNTSGSIDTMCAALTQATAQPTADWGGTVFTIVMENKNASDILGNQAAPFINALAKQGAVAAGYHDSFVHPSEPNYLWMAAGENFGVLDDDDPVSHHINVTSHIADQLEQAGLTWKAYEEGMGAPCGLVSHDRYAAKHDPFVYFDDINGWDGAQFQPSARCNSHVVDFSELDKDIAAGTLPKYVFITPNLDDDMHDGSIAQGDQWLAAHIPALMQTKAYQNGGALFLLWDEGSGSVSPGDDPPFLVVSPNAKVGYVSHEDYDTSSFLKTVENILGLPQALPCDPQRAAVTVMDDLFVKPASNHACS